MRWQIERAVVFVELAGMRNVADRVVAHEASRREIGHQRTGPPARPEVAKQGEVFLRLLVSTAAVDGPARAEGRARAKGRDEVHRDAPSADAIERGEAAGHRERVRVKGRNRRHDGDPVDGSRGHGGELERLERRGPRAGAHAPAVHAGEIGLKQDVEAGLRRRSGLPQVGVEAIGIAAVRPAAEPVVARGEELSIQHQGRGAGRGRRDRHGASPPSSRRDRRSAPRN